jgi:hypothetical protein
MNDWGLLPDDVQAILQQKEWDCTKNLRDRLSGKRRFPIKIALKVPTGAQALSKVSHFHEYIKKWQQSPYHSHVTWEQRQYRELGTHDIPATLTLESIQSLIEFVGPKAVARSEHWQKLMMPILDFDSNLYTILIRHLLSLENMEIDDVQLIPRLLSQLHKGIGSGSYLRALPLKDVDTKFLENNFALISDLLDSHFGGEISSTNGLMNWLDCVDIPKAWLLVRPLCQQTKERMGGLPILQLSTQTLRENPLPARNILVVENKQSGYGLPTLADTIAVFGGGANINWMNAKWLSDKSIGYWGDIDTWGLTFLSDARQYIPDLQSIMMDKSTLIEFEQRTVPEPSPSNELPPNLLANEMELFEALRQGIYRGSRLEQERLSADYIENQLLKWATL